MFLNKRNSVLSKKSSNCFPTNLPTSGNGVNISRFNIDGYDIAYISLDRSYDMVPAVNAVVSKIANSVAALEPIIVATKDNSRRGVKKGDRLEEHPFWDVIRRTNEEQIWTEFLRDCISDYELDGTSFIYAGTDRSGVPVSLRRVKRKNITVEENNKTGNPDYYELQHYNGSIEKIKWYPFWDVRNRIFRVSQYNAKSMFFADLSKSSLSSAIDEIRHTELASKYNLSFLEKGARPSFALIVDSQNGNDGNLTQEQKDALRQRLADRIGGSANAGEIMLLEGGLDIKQLSTNAKDMDFKDLMELSITLIAMVEGVPPEELGLSGAKTYASAEEARKAFYNNVIIPLADVFYAKITSWFMPRYSQTIDKNARLTFDKKSVNVLFKDRIEAIKLASESNTYTVDELRELVNLDKVKYGDEVLISNGRGSLEFISKNFTTRENIESGENNAD